MEYLVRKGISVTLMDNDRVTDDMLGTGIVTLYGIKLVLYIYIYIHIFFFRNLFSNIVRLSLVCILHYSSYPSRSIHINLFVKLTFAFSFYFLSLPAGSAHCVLRPSH